jgi:hypothetical protein
MSMSDIAIEIEERLAAGQTPDYIAGWLEIPVKWVYDTQEIMDCDPQEL